MIHKKFRGMLVTLISAVLLFGGLPDVLTVGIQPVSVVEAATSKSTLKKSLLKKNVKTANKLLKKNGYKVKVVYKKLSAANDDAAAKRHTVLKARFPKKGKVVRLLVAKNTLTKSMIRAYKASSSSAASSTRATSEAAAASSRAASESAASSSAAASVAASQAAEASSVAASEAAASEQAAQSQAAQAAQNSTPASSAGYHKDASGRWHRANGQFASRAEIAAAGLQW